MEINTVFEIKAISDFDIRYTVCIMVHKDKLRVYDILKEPIKLLYVATNSGVLLVGITPSSPLVSRTGNPIGLIL